MKKCTKCHKVKSKSKFYKNKLIDDGLNPRCKQCEKIRMEKYYKDNRKKLLEQKQEYYNSKRKQFKIKNDRYYTEKREEILIQKREYYLKHRVKILHYLYEYMRRPEIRKRTRGNRDKRNKRQRAYNKQHPELIKEIKRRRRLRKKQLFEDFTIEEWKEKVDATKGICPICRRAYSEVYPFVVTLDHTPPISQASVGFRYTINEIMPMCGQCNLAKGASF